MIFIAGASLFSIRDDCFNDASLPAQCILDSFLEVGQVYGSAGDHIRIDGVTVFVQLQRGNVVAFHPGFEEGDFLPPFFAKTADTPDAIVVIFFFAAQTAGRADSIQQHLENVVSLADHLCNRDAPIDR